MFRLSSSLLALGLFLTGAGAENLPLTQCPNSADKFGLKSVTVSALPVKSGTPLTLSVNFVPKQDIDGGNVVVAVSLMGMALTPYKVDICNGAKLKCPLKADVPATAQVTYNIPPYAPTATVDAHITAVDKADQPLACVDTKVQLVNPRRGNPNVVYM